MGPEHPPVQASHLRERDTGVLGAHLEIYIYPELFRKRFPHLSLMRMTAHFEDGEPEALKRPSTLPRPQDSEEYYDPVFCVLILASFLHTP